MEDKKKVTLIIRGSEDLFKKGGITWSGAHMEKIKSMFPEVMSLDREQIDMGLGMFARNSDKNLPVAKLKIFSFNHDRDQVCVRFHRAEDLEIMSGDFAAELCRKLRKAGILPADNSLPFCLPLETDQVNVILSRLQKGGTGPNPLRIKIERNDWDGIYKMFSPIEAIPQNHPDTWDDPEILDNVAYACAKLSEASSLPRDLLHDERRKASFLKQQSRYRDEVETLRKRCIDLDGNNPGYWANLGFLHYQNVIELSAPGGRRDGDIQYEAERAIEYYDKALSLDPFRIKELYRKGYLLTRKLPKQILFGRKPTGQNYFEIARKHRHDGIESLLKAVEIFESLQEEKQKRYRKEYIKSLFHLGKSHYDEIFKVWDEGVFALDLRSNIGTEDKVGHIPQDSTTADLSWKYFCKCWSVDRQNSLPNAQLERPDPDLTETGVEEGVDKLYWLGKTAFAKYWSMSGYGQMDSDDASCWRDLAESYLTASLAFPWSDAKTRKPKDFVAELLARVYITKSEYGKAIECISKHCPKHLPYISQTMALAYQLSGRSSDARRILQEAVRDRGNKEPWTTHFLMGCAYVREDNFEMAKRSFNAADEECRKRGKQTLDTVLVGLGFISYKMNNTAEAISYLKQSLELNPYRVSVRKHLEHWETINK